MPKPKPAKKPKGKKAAEPKKRRNAGDKCQEEPSTKRMKARSELSWEEPPAPDRQIFIPSVVKYKRGFVPVPVAPAPPTNYIVHRATKLM